MTLRLLPAVILLALSPGVAAVAAPSNPAPAAASKTPASAPSKSPAGESGKASIAAPAASVLETEARRIAAMAKAKPSVLAVFSPDGQGGGSGVVITPDGFALTNFHVVAPCGKWMQCGMADGKIYDAVLVGLDPTGDVALIKLFGRDDFPHAEIGDSDAVRVGDDVFAMGNPFLLASDLQPTVSFGIVSGVHRYQFPAGTLLEYADCLQTDAAINPGNSGGPLFDAAGRLIGINGRGSFEKRGRVHVGAGYAISINQIKNFLGGLRGGRVVDHATLGALADFDAEGRVVVTEVLETSDAYRRGLRYDDEIISLAGRTITTPNGLKNVLGILPRDWRVPLSYRRKGRRYDVMVRLAGVHGEEELAEKLADPKETPKPDDKKKPALPGKPSGGSPKPGIQPIIPLPKKADAPKPPPVPEIVKKHFREKRGFANYYFNEKERQRVFDAWQTRIGRSAEPWVFAGRLDTGGEFVLRIDDAGASLKTPGKTWTWSAGDQLGANLEPPGSGGLLPAFYVWRRLAVVGPSRFGDVRYDGQAPLPGRKEPADVLAASHKGAGSRFYFDPATGDLLAIEFFAADDADPCEVYFYDCRENAGRVLPSRIDVRFGDDHVTAMSLEPGKREKSPEKGKESRP